MSDADPDPDENGTDGTGTDGTGTNEPGTDGTGTNEPGTDRTETVRTETVRTETGSREGETDASGPEPGVSWARFARIVVLVAFVSAVFLFAAANALGGVLFQLAVGVIGSVALVTVIVGFLIGVASVAA